MHKNGKTRLHVGNSKGGELEAAERDTDGRRGGVTG